MSEVEFELRRGRIWPRLPPRARCSWMGDHRHGRSWCLGHEAVALPFCSGAARGRRGDLGRLRARPGVSGEAFILAL